RQAPAANDAPALRQQRNTTRRAAERGAEQTVQAYLTGKLEASVDVTGTGRSTAEILSTLEGPITVLLHDGTMSHLVTEAMGIDLAEALGVVVKGDDVLPLRCARLDFATHNGVMRLTRGVLDNPDTTIRVAGQLDLRSEQLSLVARARPKDVSLASLRSPVIVRGTLGSPQVSIEPSRLAARAAGAVALGALVGPLAALIPLIDLGDREAGDPCAAPGNGADAAAKPAASAASRSAAVRGERRP
ncbi:MAG TPA: AsmA-like C-terminal region-containing protein, partial [Burkholderiaceae bacterium]